MQAEDQQVLDGLEFEASCAECGEQGAEWWITLECCDVTTVKCLGCYARWETAVALQIGRPVRCTTCTAEGFLSWGWYRTGRI